MKLITLDTATQFGFHDRGLLREGMAADSGGVRSGHGRTAHAGSRHRPASQRQAPAPESRRHAGYTVVNGRVLLRDNEPTGNLPGQLAEAARLEFACLLRPRASRSLMNPSERDARGPKKSMMR